MFTMPDSWFLIDGVRYDCKAAIMDVGLDMPDPGMTFDGVKCGERQVCLSHRCVSVEALDAPSCEDCNGHGVCNSLGQCHCDLNYAPPFCQNPGSGGSFHSGPAQEYPPNSRGLMLVLCLFLLVVLPFCVVLIILIYRNYSCVKFFALQWCRRCQSNNFFSSEAQKSSGGDLDLSLSAVAIDDSTDTAASLKSPDGARRAVSFQREDISCPLLQSCTNSSLDEAPPGKTHAAVLTHVKACRAANARDENQTIAKTKSKTVKLDDNEDSNLSVTSLASDESSAAGTTDMQTLLPKQCTGSSTRFPAPRRPAPPPPPPVPPPPPPPHSFASSSSSPPYARPMKIMTESKARVTGAPLNCNSECSSKSEDKRSVVVSNSQKPQNLPFAASTPRRGPETDKVPLHRVPERKSFDKPSTDCKTENASEPWINSVSRLRRTFEGKDSSSDPTSDNDVSANRKISFQPGPPKVHPSSGKVSSPLQSAEPSKPAVPKRPDLGGRPEAFSTGPRVRQAAGQLQHRASSEASVKTNANPPHVTKPVPR